MTKRLLSVGVAAGAHDRGCRLRQLVLEQQHQLVRLAPGRRRQHPGRAADVEVAVRLREQDQRNGHLRRDRQRRRDRPDHLAHGRLRRLRRAADPRTVQGSQRRRADPVGAERHRARLQRQGRAEEPETERRRFWPTSTSARSPPGTTRRSPSSTPAPACRAPRSPPSTAATAAATPTRSPTTSRRSTPNSSRRSAPRPRSSSRSASAPKRTTASRPRSPRPTGRSATSASPTRSPTNSACRWSKTRPATSRPRA